MEFETSLGIKEFEEFNEEEERAFSSFDIEDSYMPSLIETEAQFESKEEQSTEVEEKRAVTNEEHRSLYIYFKELARESLLTPRQEVEISTKMRKCRAKVREIKAVTNKLSKKQVTNGAINNNNRYGKRKDPSKEIRRLNSLMKTYSKKAQDLRERFLKGNLRLVVSIARKYTGLGLPFSDLIQAGNLGLIKAMERFDPARGYRFSTYASWWIRQSISRTLSTQVKTVRIPEYVLEQARKVYGVRSMLHRVKGTKPLPGDIAEKTGFTVEYVKRILGINTEVSSLDSPLFVDGDKITSLDFIADVRPTAPDSIIAKAELKRRVGEALSLLTSREEEIIRMRFGIGLETKCTLDEVGKRLNLTRERIRQLEGNAIKKLVISDRRRILRSFYEE